MNKISLLAVFAALSLTACAGVDGLRSTMEPIDGGFKFVTFGGVSYPVDSPKAETTRMSWLEDRLRMNNLCTNGYEIVDRKAVVRVTGMLGTGYDIFYTGKCR